MISPLDRYLATCMVRPLAAVLGLAALLLLLERMVRLIDLVAAQHGSAAAIWRMLATLVPHYLGLALPLGVFLGAALALQRLALSHELPVLQAAGLSWPRLLRPVCAVTLIALLVNLAMVSLVQPHARAAYNRMATMLARSALYGRLADLQPVRLSDGTVLAGRPTGEPGGLTGIFLVRTRPEGGIAAISAATGHMVTDDSTGVMALMLGPGRALYPPTAGRGDAATEALHFRRLAMPLRTGPAPHANGPEPRELPLTRLIARADETPDFRAEAHWRVVFALSLLPLPALASAIGPLAARRGGRLALIAGLVSVVAYHEGLEAAAAMAARGASPWHTLWPVFGVYTALCLGAAIWRLTKAG